MVVPVDFSLYRKIDSFWVIFGGGVTSEADNSGVRPRPDLHPLITEYGGYLARQITAGTQGVYS